MLLKYGCRLCQESNVTFYLTCILVFHNFITMNDHEKLKISVLIYIFNKINEYEKKGGN